MTSKWLKRPQSFIAGSLALVLLFAVACGSAAEQQASPTSPPAAPAAAAVPQAPAAAPNTTVAVGLLRHASALITTACSYGQRLLP